MQMDWSNVLMQPGKVRAQRKTDDIWDAAFFFLKTVEFKSPCN